MEPILTAYERASRLGRVSLALALLGAGPALAQPGDHIRAGDAVVIPEIDLGVEHHTNAYRQEASGIPGTALRVAPGLEISAEGQDVEFTLGGQYELRKYFQQRLSNLDRYNDFNVNAGLDVRQEQALGFELKDSVGLRNSNTQALGADEALQTQFRNNLAGTVMIRPSSALEFGVGGMWAFDAFQVPERDNVARNFNQRNGYGPTLTAQWTFFPRTALVVSGGYTMYRWADNIKFLVRDQAGVGTYLALPNSAHTKVMAGLKGRVTERLALTAMAGYGTAVYDEESVADDLTVDIPAEEMDPASVGFTADVRGLDHLLVQIQGRYDVSEVLDLTAGYDRDFEDAWFTNYISSDYIYGAFEGSFSQRFGARAEVGSRFESYFGEIGGTPEGAGSDRRDIVLRARGDLSYNVQDWASLTAGVWWDQRASTDNLIEYDNVNIHLLTTFTY